MLRKIHLHVYRKADILQYLIQIYSRMVFLRCDLTCNYNGINKCRINVLDLILDAKIFIAAIARIYENNIKLERKHSLFEMNKTSL